MISRGKLLHSSRRALPGLLLATGCLSCGSSSSTLSSNFFAGATSSTNAWWFSNSNLDLDFANDRYYIYGASFSGISNFIAASGATFSRASTATYYGPSGLIQTAAINTPRLDYDPATGAAKGILTEEASTNFLAQSGSIGTAPWANTGTVTVNQNATIAPDGTMTATMLTASGSGASYINEVPTSALASHTVTRSYYLKAGTTGFVAMEFADATNCGAFCVAQFNINTQSASWGSGAAAEGPVGIQSVGNGWYRVYATFTYSGVGASNTVLYIGAYGSGVGSLYIWGAQTEFRAFPTSYIPTTTTFANRSADSFAIPVGSWFNASTGTFYSQSFGQLNSQSTNYGRVIGGDTPISFTGFGGGFASVNPWNNNTSATATGAITASPSVSVKMCLAWDQTPATESYSISGVLGTASYGGNWATTNIYPGGTNFTPLNASVTRISFFPTRLSNSALTALTQ